ncbi:unnamed protein product [Dracunculus medinensis]|uniref:protein-tyrosine-phosphatase n=1 Tax=Dracunculus medinensis TaxID=318479 RepID=A0A0N4U6R1_DRAME|nr:unnamed protein product [Dracunculus medinensis]
MVAPLKPSKGLLERRGSSASLTINLGISDNSIIDLSPIQENLAIDDSGSRKSRFLTRHQLKNLNIIDSLPEIFAEFAMLPNPNISCCTRIAGCSQKNRHQVWPIGKTRVRIWDNNSSVCSQDTPRSTNSLIDDARNYINANYITDDNLVSSYIATEGPMPNTINDFWAMIWQEKSIAIVMMTKLEEQTSNDGQPKSKCEKYWPEEKHRYGAITVEVENVDIDCGIIVHELLITRGDEEHRLRHYWFTEWNDHRLPIGQISKILKLILDLHSYRAECRKKFTPLGPITVHCSAGIGRTCTFIAMLLGIEQLNTIQDGIDIYAIVSKLRMERYGAVPRPEQYVFIYLALQQMECLLREPELIKKRLIAADEASPYLKLLISDFREDEILDEENVVDTTVHISSNWLNVKN